MFVLYTDNSNYRNFLYDIYLFTSHNFYINIYTNMDIMS